MSGCIGTSDYHPITLNISKQKAFSKNHTYGLGFKRAKEIISNIDWEEKVKWKSMNEN